MVTFFTNLIRLFIGQTVCSMKNEKKSVCLYRVLCTRERGFFYFFWEGASSSIIVCLSHHMPIPSVGLSPPPGAEFRKKPISEHEPAVGLTARFVGRDRTLRTLNNRTLLGRVEINFGSMTTVMSTINYVDADWPSRWLPRWTGNVALMGDAKNYHRNAQTNAYVE